MRQIPVPVLSVLIYSGGCSISISIYHFDVVRV